MPELNATVTDAITASEPTKRAIVEKRRTPEATERRLAGQRRGNNTSMQLPDVPLRTS
jgi:hypothetical protein